MRAYHLRYDKAIIDYILMALADVSFVGNSQ